MATFNWTSKEEIELKKKIADKEVEEQKQIQESLPSLLLAVRKMIRVDEITVEELLEMMYIYPIWEVGINVEKGKYYRYNDKLYQVNQAHLTQENHNPERANTLFFEVLPQDVIGEWKPYDGVVIYQIGSKVIYNGKVYESTAPNNVWKPDEYGWKLSQS